MSLRLQRRSVLEAGVTFVTLRVTQVTVSLFFCLIDVIIIIIIMIADHRFTFLFNGTVNSNSLQAIVTVLFTRMMPVVDVSSGGTKHRSQLEGIEILTGGWT